MTAQNIESERKRSRPVTKKGFKKNKLALGVVLIIICIIIIAGAYIVFFNNKESSNNNVGTNPIAIIDTSMGIFKVELYQDKVPITAQNFIDLANSGYYDEVTFHRVIKNFMIQGGDPKGDGTGGHAAKYHTGYGDPNNPDTWVIPDEFHDDLSNIRGTISMANRGPNTGGSQFFINIENNTYLDYNIPDQFDAQHAVFGRVIEGMYIVDKISLVNTDSNDKPLENVVINTIIIENQ
jgi:cyclophilin family peptidyl-prolyl cis-trans isomerase